MVSLKRLLALAAGLLFLTASLASAQDSNPGRKIDKALKESLRKGGRTQRVIITVAPGCRANMLGALRQHGDVIKSEHRLIDALSAETHSEDVEELAKHPCVRAVAADATVYADDDDDDDDDNQENATRSGDQVTSGQTPSNVLRETLGLPAVATRDSMTGATGIGVVLIDSGIAPSDNFRGRITAFYDFTRGGIRTSPFDDYGHGTHIAGLIGSSGVLSSYEYQGIAPRVRLIGLKVLDKTGKGQTSDVISAIEFAIANKERLNGHIMNLSLGHPIYAPAKDDPLVQAVEKASDAGYIVVVSAGNNGQSPVTRKAGYTGITSPGNARSAITVGAAMNQNTVARGDDSVASYSSRGPTWFDAFAKPDVVAPGHRLLSDLSIKSELSRRHGLRRARAQNGQALLELSGTSMSTAVTSGVVALVLQQHNQNGLHRRQKRLSSNLVKAMLQFSAIPVSGADYLTQGTGQINAAGAMALAKYIDTGAKPGDYWLTVSVEPYTTIGGQTYAWSQHVIWNDTVLTGDLLYYNLAPWSVGAADDDNIIWGTDDDNIIWGTFFHDLDNIIWGTHALVDDDNIIWGTTSTWAANLVGANRIIGLDDGDNIIWGTDDDNIIWGTLNFDNIIWGTWDGDNVIWGTWDGDNIIWGTDDNVIWGTFFHAFDNIIWGTFDNVIWGTDDNVIWGTVLVGSGFEVF